MKNNVFLLLFGSLFLFSFSSYAEENENYSVSIFVPLVFQERIFKTDDINRDNINTLENFKVYMGENDPSISGVELASPENFNYKENVSTCHKYVSLKKEGWNPATTFDITMESFFIQTCGTLSFLKEAIFSKNTRFEKKPFQEKILKILPAEIWETTSISGEPLCPSIKTLDQCLASLNEKNQKEETDEIHQKIHIENDSDNLYLQVLAKGDYDHDGWEDILVNQIYYIKGASYRSFQNFCLKWSPDEKNPAMFKCAF